MNKQEAGDYCFPTMEWVVTSFVIITHCDNNNLLSSCEHNNVIL